MQGLAVDSLLDGQAPLRHRPAAFDYDWRVVHGAGDPVDWGRYAILQLALDEVAGYRRACAEMLERFGEKDDTYAADLVAWTWANGPHSAGEGGPYLRLAERAAAGSTKDEIFRDTLGAVLYRAGRTDAAVRPHDSPERNAR